MTRVGLTPAARATYGLGLGQALQVAASRLGAAGTATIRWLCGLPLTRASKQAAGLHGSRLSAGANCFNVEASDVAEVGRGCVGAGKSTASMTLPPAR